MLLNYQEINMLHGLPKYHVEICIKKLCKYMCPLKFFSRATYQKLSSLLQWCSSIQQRKTGRASKIVCHPLQQNYASTDKQFLHVDSHLPWDENTHVKCNSGGPQVATTSFEQVADAKGDSTASHIRTLDWKVLLCENLTKFLTHPAGKEWK